MLKKLLRLPRKKIQFSGNFQNPYCTIRISKNDLDYSRFGFVVSKKIDKRAVKRNLIKRAIRCLVEQNINNFTKGLDFLFIVRKTFSDQEKESVLKNISQTLKKENLLQ